MVLCEQPKKSTYHGPIHSHQSKVYFITMFYFIWVLFAPGSLYNRLARNSNTSINNGIKNSKSGTGLRLLKTDMSAYDLPSPASARPSPPSHRSNWGKWNGWITALGPLVLILLAAAVSVCWILDCLKVRTTHLVITIFSFSNQILLIS